MAWSESEDRSGVETGLAAVSDQLFVTSGDSIKLPSHVPYILMVYGLTSSASYPLKYIKLTAPSIAQLPLIINEGGAGTTFNPSTIWDVRDAPFDKITPGDYITAYSVEDDEAGVAHRNSIVAIIGDGALPKNPPTPPGIFPHKCTVSGTTTGGSWTTLDLTQTNELPAGVYELWGAVVESPTAIAARFIMKGLEGVRPATIPIRSNVNPIPDFAKNWGIPYEFVAPDQLPSLEILTESNETPVQVELYVRYVRKVG